MKQQLWSYPQFNFPVRSVWSGQYPVSQGCEVTANTWAHRVGISGHPDPHLPTPPPPARQHRLHLPPRTHFSADQKQIKRRAWLKRYWRFNEMLMPPPALRPSTIFFLSPKPTLSKVSTTLKRQREGNGTH